MGVKRAINNNMQHDGDHGDDDDVVAGDKTNTCNKNGAATTLKAAPAALARITVVTASAR